jgi:hypothetical protein
MAEKMQEGKEVKVPAKENKSWLPSMFQTARKTAQDRRKNLDKEEEKYAAGGMVRRGYGKARGA